MKENFIMKISFGGDHSLKVRWSAVFHAKHKTRLFWELGPHRQADTFLCSAAIERTIVMATTDPRRPTCTPPPPMHRGCPRKDWQRGCSCTTSRGRARTEGSGLSTAFSTLTMYSVYGVNKSKCLYSVKLQCQQSGSRLLALIINHIKTNVKRCWIIERSSKCTHKTKGMEI